MSTQSWVITTPRSIEIAQADEITIQLNDGGLQVVGEPGRTTAALEVTEISDRPVHVTQHDGQVRIGYEYTGFEGVLDRVRVLKDSDTVEARLVVPAETTVRVTTARAGVKATGLRATVSITTATGQVATEDLVGPLSVKTASADVDIERHTGDLKVSTGSGEVEAEGALGRVTVQTVSGEVELKADGVTPLVDVRTVSGDVKVRLGEGVPVNLRARSVTGKVALDGATIKSSGRATSVTHTDDQGASGAYISTNTVSGDLVISRS